MKYLVKEIIDKLPGSGFLPPDTVDGYLCGEPDAAVSGIAVTFLATLKQCMEAVQKNCNVLITHEGIWYSHRDLIISEIEQGNSDPVYLKKHSFILDHHLTVYRYHDGIHRALPDRITAGLINKLGWTHQEIKRKPTYSILELNSKLEDIILYIKEILGLSYLRYIGQKDLLIHRVMVTVGYRGSGSMILPLMAKESVDLVIFGEGPEWEIPEYCRDAQTLGLNKTLIILGHGASESPGMELLADELRQSIKDVPIHYFPFKNQLLLG